MYHRMISFKRVLVTVVSCVGICLLTGCGSKKDTSAPVVLTNVAVKRMCLSSVDLHATSSSSIVAKQKLVISPEINAKILKINCKDNEMVEKGKVLYQLNDDGSSESALQTDKNNESSAKSDYEANMKAGNAIAEKDLRKSKEAWQQAKLVTQQAQVAVNKLTIRAPFAGVVHSQKQVYIGDQVDPSIQLLTLENPNNYEVNYNLPEKWISLAKPGQAVSIYHNGKIISTGTTDSTDSVVDASTGTFAVTAYIQNEEGLVGGEDVKVQQVVGKQDNVFLVPSTSLQTSNSGFFVYVVKNDRVSMKKVVEDEVDGNLIAISKGLNKGDLVVTQGMGQIHDGDHVKIDKSTSVMECSE
jgi:membrane fusion protein, multidrug efflux system